jgi:spermidine synthase
MSNPPRETRGTASLAGVILSLFFISGALALVYEVIWLRMLVLVFGSTHFAVSTVLTAFMAGLALGAYLLGRQIDRRWNPVRVYGILEIGIGLYALLVPFLFDLMLPVGRWLWLWASPTFFVFSFLRFLFVGFVLIIPCAMMGGTLPVLSRFVTRQRDSMGLSVGTLYGLNTFGAVVGTAGTGFLLIPVLGVQKSIYLAAAMNILLGVASILLSRRKAAERPPDQPAALEAAGRKKLPGDLKLVLAVFATSGFVAMIYEVAWTRVLALIIGSSVYAFTVMLTTFLVGLAAGASIMSRIADRIGEKWGMEGIAAIMAGAGATAFGTLLFFHRLPYAFSVAFHWIHSGVSTQREQFLLFSLEFLVAAMVMLPPTLFLGGMFPLVVRICGNALPLVGRSVGTAYASNTVGTIFGSALGGFAVLPLLGIQGSIIFSIMLNFLLAIILLLAKAGDGRRPRVMAAGLVAVAAVGVWALQPRWNVLLMNSGVYQYAASMDEGDLTSEGFYEYTQKYFDLRFYKEGVIATVMVAGEETTNDIWLSVNGKIDASSYGDLQTQLLSGHIPMLLNEDPKDVVVIGFASGITVGSIARYDIRSLTAVEIEPAIIEASREFNGHNHDPLSDPRVKVVIADGRNFLLVTPDSYDVIVSEPSNPWMTVASNLFTKEFFEVGRDKLNPGGVFCQWLQLYGMQPSDLQALVRTFSSVFPHVLVFNTIRDSDLLLMGSVEPKRLDLDKLEWRMSELDVATDIGRVKVVDPYDLLTYFMMGTDELEEYAGEGPINTDDNALIEFHAPRSLHFQTRQENLRLLLSSSADPIDYLGTRPDSPDELVRYYHRMAEAFLKRRMWRAAKQAVASALLISESEETLALQERILEESERRARGRS